MTYAQLLEAIDQAYKRKHWVERWQKELFRATNPEEEDNVSAKLRAAEEAYNSEIEL